jgi:hypothetical protein
MPAQINATLTAIRGAGAAADWLDSAAVDGASKWAGRAPAYYTEKRERVTSGTDSDVVLRRILIVDHEAALLIDNDDVLTFSYNGEAQVARAKLIERRDLPEIEPDLRTTRIELDDA